MHLLLILNQQPSMLHLGSFKGSAVIIFSQIAAMQPGAALAQPGLLMLCFAFLRYMKLHFAGINFGKCFLPCLCYHLSSHFLSLLFMLWNRIGISVSKAIEDENFIPVSVFIFAAMYNRANFSVIFNAVAVVLSIFIVGQRLLLLSF